MTTTKRKLHIKTSDKKTADKDALRLIPVGGLGEIGRNMSYLEYKDEIVIVDCGIQFPEESTPGVDFIIPNIASLEPKKDNIKALILTHAHFDHIGAVPYVIEKLGNPTIYTTVFTKALVEKRQTDFPNAPKLRIHVIKEWDEVTISKYFSATFFGVPHTIPDTTGVVLKTPIGNIVHFADFRLDYNEKDEPQNLEQYERVGRMGVHTFMVDSTNADEGGHSVSEKIVEKNIEDLLKNAEGRIIITTFASLLARLEQIIHIAECLGRKVILNGRSMKENVQIAQNLGYMKIKKGTIIPVEDMNKYKDEKIIILTTGAQGQSNAGLMKIVDGEHKHIRIKPGDTVIFSSSVIPGNERSVQNLHDNIARQGAVVYNSKLIDIHASGHAPKEDLTLVTKLLKPKFVVPVHGHFFKRMANGQNAHEAGISKSNIRLMDNGQVALLTKDTFTITNETVPSFYVMVDGLGVGDVEQVVLRDRLALSAEGMVVIIATIDRDKARLLKNPDIISRGFIYMKENQDVMVEMRKRIKGIFDRIPRHQPIDPDYLKSLIRDQIGQFLYNKTHRRPMILPVIIEI